MRVVRALDVPAAVSPAGPGLDKYRLQSEPVLLRDVAAALVELLPSQVEVLVGMELGGVPLAAAMSLTSGLPWAVLRRDQSPSPAAARLAGTPVADQRVALVKDMTRSGEVLASAAEVLRAHGATVVCAMAAVTWSGRASQVLAQAGVAHVPLLTVDDLRRVWSSVNSR